MRKSFFAVAIGALVSACQSAPGLSNEQNVTTASWYQCCHTTANGEAFNPDGLTAAHRTLPFGTQVRVTNLANDRTVTVRINDRGPFIRGRGLDLSRGAARQIGCISSGTCRVSMRVL
ncbi:MAG: septal ring lytic transglycosylase RlpA family protein [Pseudomonadota bacterium]